MKLRSVVVNRRKRQVELIARSGKCYPLPFTRLDPKPTPKDPIIAIGIDGELANEGATYRLASGREGSVLADQALDYNDDPSYVAQMLTYELTAEAVRRAEASQVSRRELARRLRTSVPQIYRLLDTKNSRKSIGQLVSLLNILDCDVKLVVRRRPRKGRPVRAA